MFWKSESHIYIICIPFLFVCFFVMQNYIKILITFFYCLIIMIYLAKKTKKMCRTEKNMNVLCIMSNKIATFADEKEMIVYLWNGF